MKWLILVAWYRRKRLCQRTDQDGHDAPEEVPLPCRSVGSIEQLAPSGSA